MEAVAEQLVAAGVDLRLGTSVTELRPDGTGATATLSDGTIETVDAVILAGGVRSSAGLLAPAGPAALVAPRLQFVHESDVIRSMLFVLDHEVPGIYNVAGEGLLPWTEVAKICAKRTVPLPPVGTALASVPLRMLGADLNDETLDLLRYGRGIDNRRLIEAGFRYEYTSAGTVRAFAEAMRLRNTVGDHEPSYRYESDVEQFFRHSPAVVREHDR